MTTDEGTASGAKKLMDSITEPKCANCRFVGTHRVLTLNGGRQEHEGVLVCRLNPPVNIVEYRFSEPQAEWAFPSVHAKDWCGQYQSVK